MASNRTLESTLDSLCKYSANHIEDDYLKLSQDIAFLMEATTKKDALRTINAFNDGEAISALLNVLKSGSSSSAAPSPTAPPPLDILYRSLMIVGRVVSVSPRSVFQSRFVSMDGVNVIYEDIVLSPQHSCSEDMVYAMVDFLCSLSTNHEVGPSIVINNSSHRFLFQMSLVLSKRLSFSHCINKFVNLLSRLYHEDNGRNKKEEALSDHDDDDDEDNIRSILNMLILTGFLQTVIKRMNMIKPGTLPSVLCPLCGHC